MLPTRVLLAFGLVLACVASSHAQQFSGTKIVETNSPTGIGTFTAMNVRPSISGNTVAFGGTQSSGPVLAKFTSGTFTIIADRTTSVPGGGGTFSAFNINPIGLSGSVYTFNGNGGTFSNVTGPLSAVATPGTAYPGNGGGQFMGVSPAAVSGTTFVFHGTNGPPIPTGIFSRTGTGPITTIADTATPVPGGTGNFVDFVDSTFGPIAPNISGNNIVFGGRGGGRNGLFLWNNGTISAVATNATAIPNGTSNFTSFGAAPAISGSTVAFFGAGSGGQEGIYRTTASGLMRIADRNTLVPGGSGTFTSFVQTLPTPTTEVAISGDHVVFRGVYSGGSGIYTDLTGDLTKVIATGDTLDGKTVSAVDIGQFAFDGDSIAVMVGFSNGSAAVYTFSPVPEPTGLLAIGVAGLLATRLRKRRRSVDPDTL